MREWDYDFWKLMCNRMETSSFKYGSVKPKFRNGGWYDMIKNMQYRIKCYEKTGNTEYLVDVANFAMIEWMAMRGQFIATDNDPLSVIV